MKEVFIITINPFAGRENLTFCEGKGPNDLNCLDKNPPINKKMIAGHICGSGCDKFGTCKAVFADPSEHPDLFI
jgi:hypothetical protein